MVVECLLSLLWLVDELGLSPKVIFTGAYEHAQLTRVQASETVLYKIHRTGNREGRQ